MKKKKQSILKHFSKRLEILNKSNDGFYIASEDLKLRSPGDFFGVRQSGDTGLILANVNKDFQMLLKARDDVLEFLPKYYENKEEYKYIYEELSKLDIID